MRRFSAAVLAEPDMHLVGAVLTGRAAIAVLEAESPDVVLVDLGLPDMDGIDLVSHVVSRYPQADVLVITMFADEGHVVRSIEAGATGYLLKDTPDAHVIASIRELRSGGAPISPSIARRVLARFRALSTQSLGGLVPVSDSPKEIPSPLTPRELDILRLVAKGLSFNEVATHLGLSPLTVVTHVKKIYRKLAVHSRGEAVFEAGQMGLL